MHVMLSKDNSSPNFENRSKAILHQFESKKKFQLHSYHNTKQCYRGVLTYVKLVKNFSGIILIQNAQYEEAMQILQDDCEEKGYLKSLLEALSLLGLKNYDNALEKINNITIFEGVIYLCKAFALFCLSQYGEALKSIEKALQIQEEMLEKQQLISLSLTSLILMKLERQDEAQQFFIAIQNRIENEKYIQIFELLKHQQQLEANNEGNEIQGFLLLRNLLTYIVSSIGAMNMSASEEDIELKKSKIDWWLLNVDLFDFGLDLWTLFNFDQNDK